MCHLCGWNFWILLFLTIAALNLVNLIALAVSIMTSQCWCPINLGLILSPLRWKQGNHILHICLKYWNNTEIRCMPDNLMQTNTIVSTWLYCTFFFPVFFPLNIRHFPLGNPCSFYPTKPMHADTVPPWNPISRWKKKSSKRKRNKNELVANTVGSRTWSCLAGV